MNIDLKKVDLVLQRSLAVAQDFSSLPSVGDIEPSIATLDTTDLNTSFSQITDYEVEPLPSAAYVNSLK